jgi:hypothetical protein
MKVRRREFIEVLGASVASVSFPGLHAAGRAESENESIEKGGWRLQVTPAGEIVSFTDGKLELLNHRLGDNRPRVVVGGMRQYNCDRPSAPRQDGAKLVFHYDFSGRDNFSVNYELELVDLPQGIVALKQKVGIQA